MSSSRRQMLDKFAEIGAKLPPGVLRMLSGSIKGSGIALKPTELAGFSVVLFGGGALAGLLFGGPAIGLILGGLGASVPILGCKAFSGARQGKISRQLEERGLDLAQMMHDGKSLLEILEYGGEKLDMPLAEEFRVIRAEHADGLTQEEAWSRFAARIRTAEVVQTVAVFLDFLEHGKDPLDPFRNINFKQPFEMPSLPRQTAPSTFEDSVHLLLLRTLDAMEPSQLCQRRPPGVTTEMLSAKAREILVDIQLPEPLRSQPDRLIQALGDEVEGRGLIDAMMRQPSVNAIYISSPVDIFASQLPLEMVDATNRPDAAPTPEGYQRAKMRFRGVSHLRLIVSRLIVPLGASLVPGAPNVEGVIPGGWEIAVQMQEGGVPAVALGRTDA